MTQDEKRAAWVSFAATAPVEFYATVAGFSERSPAANAAIHADALLAEMEQRFRDPPPICKALPEGMRVSDALEMGLECRNPLPCPDHP